MGSQPKRAVGLAENRITKHNEIIFTYVRKKDGKKSIPDHFYISRDKIENGNYESEWRGGVKLIIVPFSDLEILKRSPVRQKPEDWTKNLTFIKPKDMPDKIRNVFFEDKQVKLF